LTAAERRKLIGILGRLGSDHDGERAAAGLLASRLLQSAGLTWSRLLEPAVEHKLPELGTWRQTAARCLERSGSLRAWEIGFLRDLPGFRRLSVKQRYVLNEIAGRVLGDPA
jgi:hypothetical protein